ncbi:YbaN family protein [Paracoccus sp. (in: a-proteobacteria)]|uniref:YbaN family protein n=1 Tax=Paracoccus sp. TaxID=267 RepID=UPI0026E0ECCD|nr:YbaN family protein [Paracoccus sp. (in: a-proteobacteria)]MDO5647533.1 YbaN family protein [Paracoccus sp. (in: a-proteobacteria)]
MRWLWLVMGWVCVGLAVIGAVLPVMPTVPFLLAAVWAFGKSSPRLRMRILRHPHFGPPIRRWKRHGVISRVAKIWAVTAMTGGVALTAWLGVPVWAVAIQATVCLTVAAYLVTRPEG